MHGLDSGEQGELNSGGAATIWLPEHGRRRQSAVVHPGPTMNWSYGALKDARRDSQDAHTHQEPNGSLGEVDGCRKQVLGRVLRRAPTEEIDSIRSTSSSPRQTAFPSCSPRWGAPPSLAHGLRDGLHRWWHGWARVRVSVLLRRRWMRRKKRKRGVASLGFPGVAVVLIGLEGRRRWSRHGRATQARHRAASVNGGRRWPRGCVCEAVRWVGLAWAG
jgi:hypothetical protein